jgi:hypothetical protein
MSLQLPANVTWGEIAMFLQREKGRLAPECHEFIDSMARQAAVEWPSPAQRRLLHDLFQKLGGEIT